MNTALLLKITSPRPTLPCITPIHYYTAEVANLYSMKGYILGPQKSDGKMIQYGDGSPCWRLPARAFGGLLVDKAPKMEVW